MFVAFGGLGFGLVVLARWAGGWHPILATEPLEIRSLGVRPTVTAGETPTLQAQIAFPSAETIAAFAAQGRGIVATGALEPIYLREPHITKPKPR